MDKKLTKQQLWLQQVAGIGVRLEKEMGIPAEMLVAQAAVESAWGTKPCCGNNYFGIKKAARHAKTCTVKTHEYIKGVRKTLDLKFADYDSLADSCRDYAWLITQGKPYSTAWAKYEKTKDLKALCLDVGSVYATGPAYGSLVWKISQQANVRDAIKNAKAPKTS